MTERGLLVMRFGQFLSACISNELPYGDWTQGRWGWSLWDIERVPSHPAPVVVRGTRQGVCEIEEAW